MSTSQRTPRSGEIRCTGTINEQLERSILSRLTSTISGSIIGDGGDLQPGTVETTDFIIDVVDLGDGRLRIMTTDKSTGDSTSFEIDTLL